MLIEIFFDDPFYFKIEILAIRDEFVTQGHKGLKVWTDDFAIEIL